MSLAEEKFPVERWYVVMLDDFGDWPVDYFVMALQPLLARHCCRLAELQAIKLISQHNRKLLGNGYDTAFSG